MKIIWLGLLTVAIIIRFLIGSKRLKKKLNGIFVTHSHFDHIYGINDALNFFPDIPIYVSGNDGINIISDEKLNGSKYAEIPFKVISANFVEVENGSSVELTSYCTIDIMETIGHSPDSVSYLLKPFIFTGDAFIPNMRTVTKLKGGDRKQAKETVLHIFKKCGSDMIVCPGHNAICDIGYIDIEKMV